MTDNGQTTILGHHIIPIESTENGKTFAFRESGIEYRLTPTRYVTGYSLSDGIYEWMEIFKTLEEGVAFAVLWNRPIVLPWDVQ